MVEVVCDQCGTTFDTDRDGGYPGADTARCPSCGTKHEAAAEADRIADTSDPEPEPDQALAVDGGATVTITIQIDVEPQGDHA